MHAAPAQFSLISTFVKGTVVGENANGEYQHRPLVDHPSRSADEAAHRCQKTPLICLRPSDAPTREANHTKPASARGFSRCPAFLSQARFLWLHWRASSELGLEGQHFQEVDGEAAAEVGVGLVVVADGLAVLDGFPDDHAISRSCTWNGAGSGIFRH